MRKLFITLILTITSLILPDVFAKSSNSQRNHAYTGVKIAYATSELTKCSFQYSPINFCDDEHVAAYNNTLNSAPANFNGHYIILARPEYLRNTTKSRLSRSTLNRDWHTHFQLTRFPDSCTAAQQPKTEGR